MWSDFAVIILSCTWLHCNLRYLHITDHVTDGNILWTLFGVQKCGRSQRWMFSPCQGKRDYQFRSSSVRRMKICSWTISTRSISQMRPFKYFDYDCKCQNLFSSCVEKFSTVAVELNSSFWYNHHQWFMMVRDIKSRNPDEATKQCNKYPKRSLSIVKLRTPTK